MEAERRPLDVCSRRPSTVRWIIQHDLDAQDLVRRSLHLRISARASALDLTSPANSDKREALFPAIDDGPSLVGDRMSAGISPFECNHNLPYTGLQHLKDVSGYKLGTYKSAKTLWHYIFAEWRRLGQFAQRGGCGDSGRP